MYAKAQGGPQLLSVDMCKYPRNSKVKLLIQSSDHHFTGVFLITYCTYVRNNKLVHILQQKTHLRSYCLK